MKRVFSLIIAGALALTALTACGDSESCEHQGGIATCKSLAECSLCGDNYGSKNNERHEKKQSWVTTPTSHTSVYECCDTIISEETAHDWKLGTCQECLYVCEHEGGTASCTAKAVCEKCGASWGEKNLNAHAVDSQWISDASSHKKIYTCCNRAEIEKTTHNWQEGRCISCGYECLHKGGTATCQSQARCETCRSFYGSLDTSQHATSVSILTTSTNHTKLYSCCSTSIVSNEPHTFLDGRCTGCGYVCYHSGGEATCINRAICDNCGSAYGSINPANHANIYESDGSAEPGVYSCCGQYAVG